MHTRRRVTVLGAMSIALALGAALLAPASAAHAATAVIHVAPSGAGTACTPAAPCSLEQGKSNAITAAATGSDVEVVLADGTYSLTAPLEFTAADSGVGSSRVTYRAADGAVPELSGGTTIGGWEPSAEDPSVYVATAPAGLETRQLFVDGTRANRASGPVPGFALTSTGHTTTSTALASWGNLSEVEVVYKMNWIQPRCTIESVVGTVVTMKPTCWLRLQGTQYPLRLENARELLDEAGEWYLDSIADRVYYKPRAGEDLATALVVAPTLEKLVSGTGSVTQPIRNLTFEGITFSDTTWLYPSGPYGFREIQANLTAPDLNPVRKHEEDTKPGAAVAFEHAVGLTFERNTFTRLGAAALDLDGRAQENVVRGNRFFDISSNGVMVGDVTAADHHPTAERIVRDNTISNNYVTRIGEDYPGAVGIWVGYAENTLIEHNELHDLPYSAISTGWGWGNADPPGNPSASNHNVVRANLVYNLMQVLRDGGGIYSLGEQRNMLIDGNVVHEQLNDYGAIYLDDGSRDITVTRNILFDNEINLTAKGWDHVIQGNYWDDETRNMLWFDQSAVYGPNTLGEPSTYPLSILNSAGLQLEYTDLRPSFAGNLARGAAVSSTPATADLPGTALTHVTDGNTASPGVVDADGGAIVVDPGALATVGTVVVSFPRGAAPASYDVDIAGADGAWTPVAQDVTGASTRDLIVTPETVGRQVRVSTEDGGLSVAEVEVYAAGAPVPLAPGLRLRVVAPGVQEPAPCQWLFAFLQLCPSGMTSSSSAVAVSGELATGRQVGTATLAAGDWQRDIQVAAAEGYSLWSSESRVAVGRDASVALVVATADGMLVSAPTNRVVYSSSDASVATVSGGRVSVVGVGEATLRGTGVLKVAVSRTATIETYDEVFATFDTQLDKTYLHPGGTASIEVDDPRYDSGYAVPTSSVGLTYVSAAPAIATVASDGTVTAVSPGRTTVAVTATVDGVAVTNPVSVEVFPTDWDFASVNGSPGSAVVADDVWTVQGRGIDIWGRADQFGFVYQPVDLADYPDGISIETTITSIGGVHANSMTGLMLRQTLDPDSANVNYRVHHDTGSGARNTPYTSRVVPGELTSHISTEKLTLPARMRIEYVDGVAYAFSWNDSTSTWVLRGQRAIDLVGEIFVGVAHASAAQQRTSSTTFSTPVIGEPTALPAQIRAASTVVQIGADLDLAVRNVPSDETLSWSSSDIAVATVGVGGIVTGVSSGTATISVVSSGGREAELEVTVYEAGSLASALASQGRPAGAYRSDLFSAVSTHASAPAAYGNDGSTATAAQATGVYAWAYRIDLESARTLDRFEVTFRPTAYATDFEVATSWDGVKWDTVEVVTGGTGTATHVIEPDVPVPARFVAVRALKPDGASQPGGQMAVSEFAAFALSLPVHATAVVLDRSELTVGVGGVERLAPELTPAVVSDPTITWTSSAPGVATVDASGRVTGVALGATTITATAVGGASSSTEVRVRDVVERAQGKPSVALGNDLSTVLTTHQTSPVSAGNDGNTSTRAQAFGSTAWTYRIDLQTDQTIDALHVRFAPTAYATTFELLVSSDGVDWEVVQSITDGAGDIRYWSDLDEAVTARYIAVRALAPNAAGQPGGQMGVAELGAVTYAPDPPEALSNLALGASASAVRTDMVTPLATHAVAPAAHGNDGNLATRAQASGAYAWAYRVDLGSMRDVWAMQADFSATNYATAFEFVVSTDGTTWTTVATVTGSTGGTPYRRDFTTPYSVRYIGVRAVTPNAAGQPGGQMAVTEFAAYG
jgi:uncharacterized protein YjdB